jgi:uncharacterized protein HemX
MKNAKRMIIAAVAATVLTLGAGGVALAQQQPATSQATPPAQAQTTAAENSATDPDNIQEGDQNSPDTPDQAEGPENGGPENSATDPDNVQE